MYHVMVTCDEQNHPEIAGELKGISAQFLAHGHYVTYEYLVGWLWYHEIAHTDVRGT